MNTLRENTIGKDKTELSKWLWFALACIGLWWCLNPISYEWSADMVALIKIVEQFSEHGAFPLKGILSSVAAYNMPGLVWLLLPASLVFGDPRLIAMTTAIPLNLLAAFILYKLALQVMDNKLALACMILYCFSPLTFEWSRSLWAQHYLGAFYIFIAYFLAGWALERKAGYGAAAIVFIVYATMIHFSSLVLLAVWGCVWLLWRPPLTFSRVLMALLACTILLSPYLYFEKKREFIDLKAFVSGKSLLNEHVADPKPAPETSSGAGLATIKSLVKRAAGTPKGFFHLLAANFLPPVWGKSAFAISFNLHRCLLGLLFLGGIATLFFGVVRSTRLYFKQMIHDSATFRITGAVAHLDKSEQASFLFLTMILAPLLAIAFMGHGQRASFAMPFFPFQCISGFFFLQVVQSGLTLKKKPRRVTLISSAVIVGAILVTGFCTYIFYSITDGHSYSFREEKFLQKRITNFIVKDMKSNGLAEISISYDIINENPAWRFIPRFYSIDPMYHVGMEFNYFLKEHSGVSLPQPTADGLVPGARYVVVFREGVKRYDLSKYLRYDFEQFVVLVKRP